MLEKNICNKIVAILENEIRIYREILALSNEKRQILVEGKAAELDQIVRTEQRLSSEVITFEKERDEIVQSAVLSGMISKDEIIISKLSKKMDLESRRQINILVPQLAGILSELKTLNDINGELIKQSLEYIEYTVNIMSSTGTATNLTYGSNSEAPKKLGDKKTFFDTKG